MGIYVNPVFARPRLWVPTSAGTTVWRGLRIKPEDGGMAHIPKNSGGGPSALWAVKY